MPPPLFLMREGLGSRGLVETLTGRVGRQEREDEYCEDAKERHQDKQGKPASEVAIMQAANQQRQGRDECCQAPPDAQDDVERNGSAAESDNAGIADGCSC